jgi:hypothetical protein
MEYVRPTRLPEANIQAEVYRRLKELNIECVLEYKFVKEKIRADVIVIKDNKIICACEIKSKLYLNRPVNTTTKQFKKYFSLGIPIFYTGRLEKVDELINRIVNLYNISN